MRLYLSRAKSLCILKPSKYFFKQNDLELHNLTDEEQNARCFLYKAKSEKYLKNF